MLLGTLGAVSSGNMLAGKGFIQTGVRATRQERGVIRTDEGTIRVRVTVKSRRRR